MTANQDHKDRLRQAGLRPTRQRCALAGLLFGRGVRHVSAEQLACEARQAGITVSTATIYNTLHQFVAAGLLREVVVGGDRSYFDTNLSAHHHFFDPATGALTDIEASAMTLSRLPPPPAGWRIDGIDVVIRVSADGPADES